MEKFGEEEEENGYEVKIEPVKRAKVDGGVAKVEDRGSEVGGDEERKESEKSEESGREVDGERAEKGKENDR